jgi:hypothetical protein
MFHGWLLVSMWLIQDYWYKYSQICLEDANCEPVGVSFKNTNPVTFHVADCDLQISFVQQFRQVSSRDGTAKRAVAPVGETLCPKQRDRR